MSLINITNVSVDPTPQPFLSSFTFEVTFECFAPGITNDIEWKCVYVGVAEDSKYDQELDSIFVGPVAIGKNKFVFTCPPPDHTKIPAKDLLEVTVVLLIGVYNGHEFIRIGYYVNNEYPLTEIEMRAKYDEWRKQNDLLDKDKEKDDDVAEGEDDDAEEDEEDGEENDGERGSDDEELDEEENIEDTTHIDESMKTEESKENSHSSNENKTSGNSSSNSSNKTSSNISVEKVGVTESSSTKSSLPKTQPPLDVNKLHRTILADRPRVTRYPIRWDESTNPATDFSMNEQDSKIAAEEEAKGVGYSLSKIGDVLNNSITNEENEQMETTNE
jgi:histone chaperone ASF1